MFTEEQMLGWKNKPMIDQTWPNLQEKRLEQKQYSTTTAKQSRFKEAALAAQEKEAAEAEGETQAMLFAMLQEQHDSMRKPMAPLGCAIQAHVKPDDRRTWDTRSESGFNLGMSMEHHRCFRVYITRTRATRISDTVHFKHQYITNPEISPESLVVAAS